MIYTVTFNPALDYVMSIRDLVLGRLNKTKDDLLLPGGKGLNVSEVLTNLGVNNTALGFIGGFTGDEIERLEIQRGVRCDFLRVEGNSRINVKLKSTTETEINASGPDIPRAAVEALLKKLKGLTSGDTLVLAGSIPPSLPDTTYSDIMKLLEGSGVRIICDASSTLLINVLENAPFLIKPNNFELAEIFKAEIGTDKKEIAKYAMKLQEKGARNVLVSLGGEGAVLVAEDGSVHEASAPKGEVVNSVGAGDSMVAGFICGFERTGRFDEALRLGIACGSASTYSEYLANKGKIDEIYARVEVKRVK